MSASKVKNSMTLRRVFNGAVVALAVLFSSAPSVHAQVAPTGEAGTIGFYFDQDLTQTTLNIEELAPGQTITLYLGIQDVAADLPGALLDAYETGFIQPPATAGFILSQTLFPSTSLDFGGIDGGRRSLIVGTGEDIDLGLVGDKYVLASWQILLTSLPSDLRFTPLASVPSSVDPPAALWNDVSEGAARIYTFARSETAIINPIPCEVADASFAGTVVTGLDGSSGELWTYDAGKTITGTAVVDLDGDGDANVLYWTEDDGAENGEIGYLGCQGELIWNFVDSGRSCDPAEDTANYLDVVDFRVGDFTDANVGDEVLLISTAPGLTRLTLHALDGSLISNGEIWTDIGYGALLLNDGSVYLAGLDAAGNTAVLRDEFDNFRGNTIDVGSCSIGGLDFASFGDSTADVTDLAVADGVLTITTTEGTIEVDATTLATLEAPCTLESVSIDGTFVRGFDDGGLEVFTYDAGVEVVNALVGFESGQDPQVTVVGADGSVVRLDCAAEIIDDSFAFANCYGDTGAQTLAGPVVTANNIQWYLVTWAETGNTRLTSLATFRGPIVEGDAYDFPGTPTATLLATVGEGEPSGPAPIELLFVGLNNGFAGDAAQVVAIDPDDVSGSAPPVQTGCDAGAEAWSALFDGAALPSLTDGVEALALDGNQLTVTVGQEDFVFDARTGQTVVTCNLAEATSEGNVVTARDGEGNALFTYEASGDVALVGVFEFPTRYEFPVVIGLADASDTTQATAFLIDCEGTPLFETPLVGDSNCFGVAQPQAIVNRDLTGVGSFTAEGTTELWAVMAGSAGEGEPTLTYIVTVDLEAWTVLGSYLHFGAIDIVTGLDGFPLEVAFGATNAQTGASAAALIVAGADGESFPGCDPEIPAREATGERWYVNFDGTDAPLLEDPFTALTPEGDNLNFTAGLQSFLIARDTGALLTDVELSIAPATGEAKPGETYAITLELDNAADLAAVQGVLTYDAASLAVLGASSDLAGFTAAINSGVDGEVRFALASDENLGASAATLLTVEFEVLADAAVGDVPFGFADVLAFDENPSPIGILTTGASLAIGCETGDVNGDGAIRSDDAVLALRIGVGLVDPTAQQACAADVNEDGTVDSGDAVAILREVVGLPTGTAVSRQVALQIDGEGVARPLGDDRYELELTIGGNDVAGIDLTLGAPNGYAIETIGLIDANGIVAFHRDGDAAFFAAANATALNDAGDLRVRVVLRGDDLAAGDAVDLRVVDGRTYGSDGARRELEATATLTFEAPASEIARPNRTELLQNAPNPFNPRTEIFFRLAQEDAVRVHIYDVAGRRVSTLNVGTKAAGEHSVVWTGVDDSGRSVSSGVYLYQLETREGVVGSKRMTLVR